jgi:hypothetical protein
MSKVVVSIRYSCVCRGLYFTSHSMRHTRTGVCADEDTRTSTTPQALSEAQPRCSLSDSVRLATDRIVEAMIPGLWGRKG